MQDIAASEKASLSFSMKIKGERLKKGWSQEALAERIGTDPRTIQRWESGRSLPQTALRERLMELFDKVPEELGLLPADTIDDLTSTWHELVQTDENWSFIPARASLQKPDRASSTIDRTSNEKTRTKLTWILLIIASVWIFLSIIPFIASMILGGGTDAPKITLETLTLASAYAGTAPIFRSILRFYFDKPGRSPRRVL